MKLKHLYILISLISPFLTSCSSSKEQKSNYNSNNQSYISIKDNKFTTVYNSFDPNSIAKKELEKEYVISLMKRIALLYSKIKNIENKEEFIPGNEFIQKILEDKKILKSAFMKSFKNDEEKSNKFTESTTERKIICLLSIIISINDALESEVTIREMKNYMPPFNKAYGLSRMVNDWFFKYEYKIKEIQSINDLHKKIQVRLKLSLRTVKQQSRKPESWLNIAANIFNIELNKVNNIGDEETLIKKLGLKKS